MLLPSLKASFARTDDGNELVPTTGLDGSSLDAYSDQLRELQICRDDLLARRSMNNNSEVQRQQSISSSPSDDFQLCPTPTEQASNQASAECLNGVRPMPPSIASTSAVAGKRRLGFPGNVDKSNNNNKLQPGVLSTSSEIVAADILDLTGQLKASAGEVNSTLKAQTAILEKTEEEALQNVERVKRETDKVGAHLSKKRRNMFATFSAMAMALTSFIVVYILIIMPFGKRRTFSSHIVPLFFSSRRDRGDLRTADHVLQSYEKNIEDDSHIPMKGQDSPLDNQNMVGNDDQQQFHMVDFNDDLTECDGASDAIDEGHAEMLVRNHKVVVSMNVDGEIDNFDNTEFDYGNLDSNRAEVKAQDGMSEVTKDLREPQMGEGLNFSKMEEKRYPDETSEEMVIQLPDIVEETKIQRNKSFVSFFCA